MLNVTHNTSGGLCKENSFCETMFRKERHTYKQTNKLNKNEGERRKDAAADGESLRALWVKSSLTQHHPGPMHVWGTDIPLSQRRGLSFFQSLSIFWISYSRLETLLSWPLTVHRTHSQVSFAFMPTIAWSLLKPSRPLEAQKVAHSCLLGWILEINEENKDELVRLHEKRWIAVNRKDRNWARTGQERKLVLWATSIGECNAFTNKKSVCLCIQKGKKEMAKTEIFTLVRGSITAYAASRAGEQVLRSLSLQVSSLSPQRSKDTVILTLSQNDISSETWE